MLNSISYTGHFNDRGARDDKHARKVIGKGNISQVQLGNKPDALTTRTETCSDVLQNRESFHLGEKRAVTPAVPLSTCSFPQTPKSLPGAVRSATI